MTSPNPIDNNVVDLTAPNYATELALLGTTGRLTYAPKGTDVSPLANMGAYAAPFVDFGWLSDAGITESMSEEVNDFTPWQTTSSIRTSTASQEFTFNAVVWSIGGLANAVYYGVAEDDMTYDEATGVTSFTQGGDLPENMRFVLVIDVVDGDKARRFILPNCSVQERGDITYTRTEMVGYEFTFKANIDSELGYAIMRQFKEGWKPGTAGSTLENKGTSTNLGDWHVDVNSGTASTIAVVGTLDPATNGVEYIDEVTATGGTTPYTFAVTAGVLPTGITLAADGTLSGTPTATGTFTFTVTATDSASKTGTKEFTITVS